MREQEGYVDLEIYIIIMYSKKSEDFFLLAWNSNELQWKSQAKRWAAVHLAQIK